MSKHDLRARPIYSHKRKSIDAHLNVVFAALAVTRLIEDRTDWSIKRFVRTPRRYRAVEPANAPRRARDGAAARLPLIGDHGVAGTWGA